MVRKLLSACLLGGCGVLAAADIAFTGGGDGAGTDLADAANWAGGALPGAEDVAVVDLSRATSGATLTCSADLALGGLVLTNLTKEGPPLIRYRTRDLTSIDTRPCKCGRTHVRLQRFAGRSDDMLIIRGVNVFPQQIENLILKTDGLSPNYQLVVEREGSLDTMEVQVEVNESIFHDQIGKLQEIQAKLKSQIKDFFGVTTKVRLMEPHSIERSKGKATRVIDKRDLKNSL